jgi:glucokinase-like ROK family protein
MAPPQKTKTTRDLRQANRRTLLQDLYFAGSTTRLDISDQTGLSPATVTNVVAKLLNEGVVVESGLEESSGGRPRAILEINSTHRYLIGVDLGETHIQTELFDLTMHSLGVTRLSLKAEDNQAERIVDDIIGETEALLAKSNVPHDQVLGIGIGAPGLVEQVKGVSILAPNWGWHQIPLRSMLEERTSLPIYLDNGAKAMALAEAWFGAGRGVDDMITLLIGTGVGAAMIIQGKLFRGVTNSAGEWGHTKIELDGRECRCGRRGCLEAYVGAPALIKRMHTLSPQNNLPDEQIETIAAIVEASERGDPVARQIMEETARYLGAGIANLINLYNPQIVVLGGWVGLWIGEHILPQLCQFVEQYALKRPLEATTISLSQLGRNAINVGAACLTLQGFWGKE